MNPNPLEGRRVAAVGEGMDHHPFRPQPPNVRQPQQRLQVADVGMDAAVADQPEQVQRPAACQRAIHGPVEGGVRRELPVGDGAVDARQPLVDDEAGADVGVADLGVAHLPRRQADGLAGGEQRRTG